MIPPFRYQPKPARVLFGAGRIADLAAEVEALGCKRALILLALGQERLADLAMDRLGSLAVGTFPGAVMHTPVEVTEQAIRVVDNLRPDCLVAIGGGSTIGLGKAIALRTDLPQLAIPTTYAGSEMTDILGETREGAKVTQRSPKVLPDTVIYDVELTLELPVRVSATSGLNAIAHGVEALYAPDRNPVVALMAEEGIRSLAASLPRIMKMPGDRDARSMAQCGAWLCAMCLGAVSMALHHKLCHVLGGSFNLPHAETHAAVLSHAAAYNAAAAPVAMGIVARGLGVEDAVTGLHRLKEQLLGTLSLKDLGMAETGIEPAARAVCANPYANPRPVELGTIRGLIERAFHGAPPA